MISYHRVYEKCGFSIDIRTGGGKPKWILFKVDGPNVVRVATFDFFDAAKAAIEHERAILKQLKKR